MCYPTLWGSVHPLTRLVDGIMGTANRVSLSRVCAERGWECRVSQDEAMTRIKAWGKTGYQA
jgi:hypothetical protein